MYNSSSIEIDVPTSIDYLYDKSFSKERERVPVFHNKVERRQRKTAVILTLEISRCLFRQEGITDIIKSFRDCHDAVQEESRQNFPGLLYVNIEFQLYTLPHYLWLIPTNSSFILS